MLDWCADDESVPEAVLVRDASSSTLSICLGMDLAEGDILADVS